MIVHNFPQRSPEWNQHRATHFNASDAPAMLGVSPYKTRAQLLREYHTGVQAEIDTATHMRFENGHRAEALARPLAEEIIGDDLAPLVVSEGKLSASLDGITLSGTIIWEHKALNDKLKVCVVDEEGVGRDLPIHHRVQMEQQLLVSGATQALFMASAWAVDGTFLDERHCWYYSDPDLRQRIIDGWAQFERDLANYTIPESAPPEPTGKAPETLPALRIELVGQVTASNLAEFKEKALAAIRSVNRTLKTDQDFADAAKAVKWCSEVEEKLKAAKERAQSQAPSIDAIFKTIDDIASEARRVRLDLDKLVTRRRTEVKEEAVMRAFRALDDYVAALNAEIAPMRIDPVRPDFAGAIKGLSSVTSMNDRLDRALAECKIAADAAARRVRENVTVFESVAEGMEFLFADLGQIINKAPDDFRAAVELRIAKHRADEAEKERKRAEAEAQQEEANRIERDRDAEAAQRTSLVSPEFFKTANLIEKVLKDDLAPLSYPEPPTRAQVQALMKRCQIGVGGRHALDDAHSIMAECYGMLGLLMLCLEKQQADERERWERNPGVDALVSALAHQIELEDADAATETLATATSSVNPSAEQRLRESVNDVMQYQFTHSRPAMHALQELIDAADDAVDEIDLLRSRVVNLEAQCESGAASEQMWVDWLVRHGLLHYYSACKRPDGTDGPAWVLRTPHTIAGDSCESWHADSAVGALRKFLVAKRGDDEAK